MEQETDPDLEERIKSLEGIQCHACLDSSFLHEWIDGSWHIKYEKTGEDADGKNGIRLIKCDHNIDRGY
jgi:hypothetical protein